MSEEPVPGGAPTASKLYIGGLSYSTTSEGLREFFAQSGNVASATVITDRFSGQSRGFGFVEMGTAEDAQNAISQLNGRELDGRRITVEAKAEDLQGERPVRAFGRQVAPLDRSVPPDRTPAPTTAPTPRRTPRPGI